MVYFYILCFTCLISIVKSSSSLIQKRQVCDINWPLCSPAINQTWYHHSHYTFVLNQNYTLFVNSNILTFDLHLLTQLSSHGTERTVKSWFNLTNNADLSVQVMDDWFPNSLPSDSLYNKTWTLYAFLLPHYAVLPPSINVSNTNELLTYEPYTPFYVVQFPPDKIVVNKERLAHKWIIAIIVIACVVVIIATCISIWFYKNMQKVKNNNNNNTTTKTPYNLQNNNSNIIMQSSILSTPDAMMIADTFRQVMSTSDLDKSRNQVGEDRLRRQLESEGTSVLEVERRTSSTKNSKKN